MKNYEEASRKEKALERFGAECGSSSELSLPPRRSPVHLGTLPASNRMVPKCAPHPVRVSHFDSELRSSVRLCFVCSTLPGRPNGSFDLKFSGVTC